jgi:signal transduction histidine kinase
MLDDLIAPARYEAARILSIDGAVLASSGDAREELSALVRAVALDALATRRLVVGRMVPDGADLRVVTAVPLNDAAGELAAAVVLDAPAAATVLRDVRRWPVPSATGEIRIVRRSAVANGELSALAEGSGSPLALARLGASGVVRGEEADGRGVIAAIRPIGATGWTLVASVGTAEVDQPIWSLGGPVATIALALLAAHAALVAAQSRAQRAATAGRLAARMAHQLNSPLASVLANARFALAELRGEVADVDEAKEALTDAVAATQRAAAVVRSLQASARQGRELAPFHDGAANDEAVNAVDALREKVA